MRIAYALAVLGAVLPASLSAETNDEIILALTDNYAPFMTAEGGIYGDIVKEAITRLEGTHNVRITSVPWARAVANVEHGEAHGLVGTYFKPDTRPWIAPYSAPLMEESVSVFCREGVAQASWAYPDDYAGLTFGNNLGYKTPGDKFFEMVAEGKITLSESPSTEQNLQKMSAGRVDCYVNESISVKMEISALGITNVEQVSDTSVEEALIGYLKPWAALPHAQAFIADFDAAVKSMKDDGTIDKIVTGYIN